MTHMGCTDIFHFLPLPLQHATNLHTSSKHLSLKHSTRCFMFSSTCMYMQLCCNILMTMTFFCILFQTLCKWRELLYNTILAVCKNALSCIIKWLHYTVPLSPSPSLQTTAINLQPICGILRNSHRVPQ